MKLSKLAITGIVIVALILIVLVSFISIYNQLVNSQVEVDKSWGQVQSVYQRRADLIPNLVNTVKGYAIHEKEVLEAVTAARSQWSNAQTPKEQVTAANNLESAVSRLLVVVESYPDLKANQNFLSLQDELAGSENRINVERQKFNEAVSSYNKKVKMFPSNIVASMFGFEQREFFAAKTGAENAPEVTF
ncbi:MAG: LemA family protein [Candidatus Nanoarchaeia archaeon]|nr:LemA family protein [Candidatus Nanoarchaeia archaeon]